MNGESIPEDPLERVFAEFSRAWFAGKNPDKSAFCSRHPELGDALRKEIDDFLYVVEGLPGAATFARSQISPTREAPISSTAYS